MDDGSWPATIKDKLCFQILPPFLLLRARSLFLSLLVSQSRHHPSVRPYVILLPAQVLLAHRGFRGYLYLIIRGLVLKFYLRLICMQASEQTNEQEELVVWCDVRYTFEIKIIDCLQSPQCLDDCLLMSCSWPTILSMIPLEYVFSGVLPALYNVVKSR